MMGQREHFEIRVHDAIDNVVGKPINHQRPCAALRGADLWMYDDLI